MPQTDTKPYALLTISKYPLWAAVFGFLQMAVFRLPLMLKKNVGFWRLMGCGRNGTFDIVPDLTQWAILTIVPLQIEEAEALAETPNRNSVTKGFYGSFIVAWHRFFGVKNTSFLLEPLEGHGLWNGRTVFGPLPKTTGYEGEMAVLTRATIKLSKLASFWKSVDAVAQQMVGAPGFKTSYGIGEIPFVKQATFSVWQSRAHMKQFAYGMQQHKTVVQRTHKEQWYSEEMFVRFKILRQFSQ
ncbi:MAG: spheroidene monooxygenase [Bacteroidetes bacterium]|nr:MAG: spheroidene monooxygenase [Bacteroidota bacterium]